MRLLCVDMTVGVDETISDAAAIGVVVIVIIPGAGVLPVPFSVPLPITLVLAIVLSVVMENLMRAKRARKLLGFYL